jgi:hypothetical protein
MPGTKIDLDLLLKVLARTTSLSEFVQALGIESTAKTRNNMRRRLTRLGVPLAADVQDDLWP